MRLIQTLRDHGVGVTLLDDGRLGFKNGALLTDEMKAAITARRDEIVADLRKEQENVGDMILCCQAAADRFPDEAKRIGARLRAWQRGEDVDRAGIYTEAKAFFDMVRGEPELTGARLEAALAEVFPSVWRVVEPKALDMSAFDPEPPKQEALSL